MFNRKFLNMLVSLMVLTSLVFGGNFKAAAMPMDPKDETKVPHYFGPNPNWANSPFRVPDIAVTLTSVAGDPGTGATAAATVDPQTGAVTGISVINPGTGYMVAPTVDIASSAGTGAVATAVVDNSGVLTAITVTAAGNGYTAPVVTIAGGGATTDATATAFGGVDAVSVTAAGSSYTFATVEFSLPDGLNGVQATGHVVMNASNGVASIVVDNPGSGYSVPPTVTVHDCTVESPCNTGSGATATATLAIQSVVLNSFGAGYTAAPTVTLTDLTGTGAAATAAFSTAGSITAINVTNPGSGYMTPGIKKFVDQLPGLCVPGNPDPKLDCPSYKLNPTAKYIPLGIAEPKRYQPEDLTQPAIEADEYVIGLVQYRTSFSSSLPDTLVRGYVQLETLANKSVSQHFPLTNELQDGTLVPVKINGVQALGVTPPQYLGPTISATKDKPVRIVFRNLLPTGSDGDLFLPTDSSMMGSGMGPMAMSDPMDEGTVMDMVRNPMCSEWPKGDGCFKDNRATLHLHGGTTPWISDGTAHQWITPAGQNTPWPQGVSVANVPDMHTDPANKLSPVVCDAKDDGCQTFYYTNQQSARLLFYHDHSWGITRLNVYAGEAAGYLISDDTEKALINSNTIPGAADTIPLIVQDRTFVPEDSQMYNQVDANGKVTSYGQDPTWDSTRWGKPGDLWYHHVYMPAQNPGDPSGMSAYGRWMYGPWFWPPATPPYGPIANPYYDESCKLDDPDTWQYQTDPFCEPQLIPGTPNISVGMEQFNDTPIVNGTAYPTITLEPKSYRLRMLNAANDRFFNFQWYVADPTTGTDSEVALKAAELAAAQTDPNVFPTPDTAISKPGPDWIQIGSEGGFLPAPTVVDGQQVTTWITDPTRFDVGNVDLHSLLLAPAERADVIVDFSKFAGKTLILYNDAPAAFPARVPSYDYYTGAPDLSPNGAPSIPPGYGPNTRTVMQVKIAGTSAGTFDLAKLQAAFTHKADGSGVFESGQHPIIVGQAAYNSAYGTNFAASSNCNAPNSTSQRCDGLVRVNDTSVFGFNTLSGQGIKMTMPLQPKAIHDEMNSTTFDEYGRMQANLGVEAQPPSPGAQNVTLYPFVNPATEIIDGTNLPRAAVTYDSGTGRPVSDVKITPISDAGDGTQIWRITHNGVDTHPIHFHLYDVQVINRVTWDNIIIPTEPSELGWKDTVRISPLEDTIVALRPIVPQLPFEIPNAIRLLNPMMPAGSTAMFNNIDPQGNPTNPITNQLVNFGWEYVYHCHILSHEEMDMMRPVSLALPPNKPTALSYQIMGSGNNRRLILSWNDNSITETAFVVQSLTWPNTWTDVGTILSPLNQPNITQARSFTIPGTYNSALSYSFRVVAQNRVGYGSEFPTITAQSISDAITLGTAPAAPTTLTAQLQSGPQVRLTWRDNATTENGFVIERSTDGINFTQIATAPARSNTGNVTFTDTTIRAATQTQTYTYRVAAANVAGKSIYSNAAAVAVGVVAVPAAPTTLTATLQAGPLVQLSWTDNANNETGFRIERSVNGGAFTLLATASALPTSGTVTFNDTAVQPAATATTYAYRVAAINVGGTSAFTNTASVTEPALPAAPGNFAAVNGPNQNKQRSVILTWTDNSTNETGFTIQRATNSSFTQGLTTVTVAPNTTTLTQTGLSLNTQYWYRIRANNGTIIFTVWVNATPFPIRTNQ
jgi:FtsP/CotA-like multicopper oxidase with cupredoxin domain